MRLPAALAGVCLVLAACARHGGDARDTSAVVGTTGAGATAPDSPASVATSGGTVVSRGHSEDTTSYPVVRALYLNRFAAQSEKKMRHLLAIADSTEINGFVIDMKDEFGLNFRSSRASSRKNAGGTRGMVADVKALVDTVKAHGLVAIARVVAFKDPVAAEVHPEWTIRREDGTVWQDKEGLVWVNAFDPAVREYNLEVAEELAAFGFDEIQWDYIRFPEPYRSLPTQVFPGAKTSKPDALAAFLALARERLNKAGARSTADIFGLVTSVRGALEVGQSWEKISPNVDVVLPMVYPSHYPRTAFGIDRPNAEPYRVVYAAIESARKRDERMGIVRREHVRPWLQAFSLGQPKYGPEQIAEQKRAVYDAGYQGWVLWSPGSLYDVYVPALAKDKP